MENRVPGTRLVPLLSVDGTSLKRTIARTAGSHQLHEKLAAEFASPPLYRATLG